MNSPQEVIHTGGRGGGKTARLVQPAHAPLRSHRSLRRRFGVSARQWKREDKALRRAQRQGVKIGSLAQTLSLLWRKIDAGEVPRETTVALRARKTLR